jgi:hypothetical protein
MDITNLKENKKLPNSVKTLSESKSYLYFSSAALNKVNSIDISHNFQGPLGTL